MEIVVTNIQKAAVQIMKILGLSASPVGVRFVFQDTAAPDQAVRLAQHCNCQALMLARHGKLVVLDVDGIACPAAMFEKIVEHVVYLGEKAIPKSRAKKVYRSLQMR